MSLSLLFGIIDSHAQINITGANYGNARTNSNTDETILTRAVVSTATFGKLGAFPVDGQIYAQPLYISGLSIPGGGARNVVFVATMNNTVYAFDADNPTAATPIWQTNLGPSVPAGDIPYLTDLNPFVGILSTPAIDPAAQILYAVAETWESGAPVFRLHALALLTGQETANGPAVISAAVPGAGAASSNGIIAFDPFWHLQRPGLALANGNVYICFGSHGDAGNYHGWVLAYNASNVQQQIAVFNTTPNGNEGGIWQSGHAPAVDADGNVYVISGNGDFDGATNFSGSVIKLSPNLTVLDWYTPADWQYIDANDLDVGSTSAILTGALLLAGDKGGRLINLAAGQFGHVESAPGADDFLASASGIFDLALWQTGQGSFLYEHDWNGYLKSYPVTSAGITPTPNSTGTWRGDSLYSGLAISSNGDTDGILWETTGDHSTPGIPATLHAWNASDLTQELWNSTLNPADVLGAFAKFVSPLVANGRVYVPTFSNQLVIYGLKTSDQSSFAPQAASILNGASFIENSLSPGEIVAISGANLGPSSLLSAQISGANAFPFALGGVQVLFDGAPAPLLYVSSTEVGAVVPLSVSGTTQLTVETAAGQSSVVSLPVVPATPALFTTSGFGTGQAAALNEDGTVNSASNPASVGSIVSVFATGLGPTTPAGADGSIVSTLAPANLPISGIIGSLPGYVVYAGAAPGMINGAFQINIRISPLSPTGPTVPIFLQAGDAVSQPGVWIAVQ